VVTRKPRTDLILEDFPLHMAFLLSSLELSLPPLAFYLSWAHVGILQHDSPQ
jgi:hypothetical protein